MNDARPSDLERDRSAEIVIRQLDTLPTLAPVAVRLLQATSDDRTSVPDLVALIGRDQSLTGNLLAAANSAAAGVAGGVKTIDQAVVLLGFAAVRSIVLTLKVFECFDGARRGTNHAIFSRDEFWRHSLAVACASRLLAKLIPKLKVDPEEAYVAGLLHDLGKVALSAVFPKAYDRVASQADHSRADIGDFERATLGVDHTVVGRRLAERWNLPKAVIDVVWLHHLATEALPSSVSCPALIALVHLADVISREQRIGYSGNHSFYESSAQIAARMGIEKPALEELSRSLIPQVARHAAMIGLGQTAPEGLYLKALADANAELGRTQIDLIAGNRRMSAAARYFHAIGEFSNCVDASSDFSQIVPAVARAAASALQRTSAVAFGLREDNATLDLADLSFEPARETNLTLSAPPDLLEWMRNPEFTHDCRLITAPVSVRALLAVTGIGKNYSQPWVLPIARRNSMIGGVVVSLPHTPGRADQYGEKDELCSFVSNLALAMESANARAAARRLSEDLADTNRRLQQAQLQLLRSRTLSMIAEMASGAAHELNSPLTVISGRAQMLKEMSEDPEVDRALDMIHAKAHECSRIVSELMDFAQPRTPKLDAVDVASLFTEIRDDLVVQGVNPASQFAMELPPAPIHVLGDRAQLLIVLTELVRNATDALRQKPGYLSLSCRPQISDDFVEILVRDTGAGMAPQILQRAFDPFFSDHSAGRRRGLGLPRAHRIVEAHAGRIWLESRPDEGTTAHVVLKTIPRGYRPGKQGDLSPPPII